MQDSTLPQECACSGRCECECTCPIEWDGRCTHPLDPCAKCATYWERGLDIICTHGPIITPNGKDNQ